MNIEKTTYQDRLIIANAMDYIFSDIEHARSLLTMFLSLYFEQIDKKIDHYDAKLIETVMDITNRMLFDAQTKYKLTIGEASTSADNALNNCQNAQNARRCNALIAMLYQAARHREDQKYFQDIIDKAAALPDEEAIKLLEKTLLPKINKGKTACGAGTPTDGTQNNTTVV